MNPSSFNNVINEIFYKTMYLICMYKEDLALNNLQELICHEIKPDETINITTSLCFGNKKAMEKYVGLD